MMHGLANLKFKAWRWLYNFETCS